MPVISFSSPPVTTVPFSHGYLAEYFILGPAFLQIIFDPSLAATTIYFSVYGYLAEYFYFGRTFLNFFPFCKKKSVFKKFC